MEKLYKERDASVLDEAGDYYSRHISAMTRENLDTKADIAAELGYRDSIIDMLRAKLNPAACSIPMTLPEAIAHAEEVAAGEGACAEQHAQLAAWLKDYSKLLEKISDLRTVLEAIQKSASELSYHPASESIHNNAGVCLTFLEELVALDKVN